MPSNPIPAAALALLVLTSCATTSAPPAASAAADKTSTTAKSSSAPKVVCDEEMETGSHISRRRCHPVETNDQDRTATQEDLSRQRAVRPPTPGT